MTKIPHQYPYNDEDIVEASDNGFPTLNNIPSETNKGGNGPLTFTTNNTGRGKSNLVDSDIYTRTNFSPPSPSSSSSPSSLKDKNSPQSTGNIILTDSKSYTTMVQMFDCDNVEQSYPLHRHIRNLIALFILTFAVPTFMFAVIPLQPLHSYGILMISFLLHNNARLIRACARNASLHNSFLHISTIYSAQQQ